MLESSNTNSIDQFSNLIHNIKNNPSSRRLLMTNYNPLQVEKGVLYPCHSLILQVINGTLSVSMYQRSADVFLGLPFNISTSLLLTIISKLTNLKPGNVTINLGDCHIYKDHYEHVATQLKSTLLYFQPEIPDFTTITDIEQSFTKIIK